MPKSDWPFSTQIIQHRRLLRSTFRTAPTTSRATTPPSALDRLRTRLRTAPTKNAETADNREIRRCCRKKARNRVRKCAVQGAQNARSRVQGAQNVVLGAQFAKDSGYAIAARPLRSISERSLSDGPAGRFSPRSHWLIESFEIFRW